MSTFMGHALDRETRLCIKCGLTQEAPGCIYLTDDTLTCWCCDKPSDTDIDVCTRCQRVADRLSGQLGFYVPGDDPDDDTQQEIA